MDAGMTKNVDMDALHRRQRSRNLALGGVLLALASPSGVCGCTARPGPGVLGRIYLSSYDQECVR